MDVPCEMVRVKGASEGRQRSKTEAIESVGENQHAWLDTLKEEIANMK
jgi:hypothetical protein